MRLQDHVVLVTGGARGIGLAVVRQALAEGARVAAWALHPESLEELRKAVPGVSWTDGVDVGDPDQVAEAMGRLNQALGPVDVLINNAGYTLTSRFLDEDPGYWHRVVDTNFWGVVHTMYAVLPSMQERGTGSIVNVVSDAGRVGMAGEAIYAGAKGGVVAFSKSLAQEMARHTVRINCVAPGPTRTRILETNTEDGDAGKLIDKMVRRIPLRRIGEPEEIAQTVVFLASSEASYMTGQVISVSGGLTMV